MFKKEKTMNNLRLRHRVRFRDNESEPWSYGYFIAAEETRENGLSVYLVFRDGDDHVTYWDICKLDPLAQEFLAGDNVENPSTNFKAIYIGKRHDGSHIVEVGNGRYAIWSNCRYPREDNRPDKDSISQLEQRVSRLEQYCRLIGHDLEGEES